MKHKLPQMLLAPMTPNVLNDGIPTDGGLYMEVVVNAKTNYAQDAADATAPEVESTTNAPSVAATQNMPVTEATQNAPATSATSDAL